MKHIWLALALLAGCTPAPSPVELMFNAATSGQPGTGYRAGTGTATEVDGVLTLKSSAGGATLTIEVDAVLQPIMVAIGERHVGIEYTLGAAGWTSNAGSISITSVDPYEVIFNNVEMRAANTIAQGQFNMTGSAIFRK